MRTPEDQRRLDQACALLDSVASTPGTDPVSAMWALQAADHLARAGARSTPGRSLTDTPDRTVRQVLRLLGSVSFETFSEDAVLDAVHATQRLHAAAG